MPDTALETRIVESPQGKTTPIKPKQPSTKGNALRKMGYEEGSKTLSPRGGVLYDTDPMKIAQKTVTSASLSATLEAGDTAYKDDKIEVVFETNSRLSVSLGWNYLSFTSEPGILIKIKWAPDLRLNNIRWLFDEARFDVSANANWFDIFHVIGNIGEKKIESVLNQKLKPLLPLEMQRPGYDPKDDPNISETIGKLAKVFDFAGGEKFIGKGSNPKEKGAFGLVTPLKDPSAYLGIEMPEDMHVPLGQEGLELFIAKGQHISISATGKGKLEKPVVEYIQISAQQPGLVIRPVSGAFKDFKRMDITGITIKKGGDFSFEYDLSIEKMGEGLIALFALFSIAAGQSVTHIPDVKFQELRKKIDARLAQEVPPRFKEFLKKYNNIVPGLSLMSVFGV